MDAPEDLSVTSVVMDPRPTPQPPLSTTPNTSREAPAAGNNYHQATNHVHVQRLAKANRRTKEASVGERSNFKKIPTHTQDHGDA